LQVLRCQTKCPARSGGGNVRLNSILSVWVPEEERRDFMLYLDEFRNFATDSFASILSEAHKSWLSLVAANQHVAQLSQELQHAVFGNAGTRRLWSPYRRRHPVASRGPGLRHIDDRAAARGLHMRDGLLGHEVCAPVPRS
jgi:hypothetical protein